MNSKSVHEVTLRKLAQQVPLLGSLSPADDFKSSHTHTHTHTHTHNSSEVAGLLLIDPAVESLFDIQSDSSNSDSRQSDSSESQTQSEGSLWAEYWYSRAVPHMQSVQMSASLGFSRIGLMLGLMTPVEEPGLQKILPEEVIIRKVGRPGGSRGDIFSGLSLSIVSPVPRKAYRILPF